MRGRQQGAWTMTGRWFAVAVVMAVLLPVLPVPSVRADTRIVNSLLDPTDPGKVTLRQAITMALPNDTITFMPGLTGTIALTSTLTLIQNVTITGPGAASLILSGGCTICGVGGAHNNGVRVFTVSSGVTAAISGLTITRGVGDSFNGGGGILNNGTLTLTNSTVSGNAAANNTSAIVGISGGGIANTSTGTLIVTGCTIGGATTSDGNTTGSVSGGGNGGNGGGIFNNGTATVTNSTISHNTTSIGGGTGGNGGNGGGIYNGGGTATIMNSTISGNTTGGGVNTGDGGYGGGIYNISGTATIMNSTISGNTTGNGGSGGNGGNGGGIYSSKSLTVIGSTISGDTTGSGRIGGSGGGVYTLTSGGVGNAVVMGSTISGNTAAFGGGVLNDTGNTLTLTGSTISGNTASSGNGGGLYNLATLTLGNVTISGDTATVGNGGGIYANTGALTLHSVTVANNNTSANGSTGGGVYYGGGTLDITNALLTANTSAGGPFDYKDGVGSTAGVTNHGSNFIRAAAGNFPVMASDIIGNATTVLGSLADNGGASVLPDGTHPQTQALVVASAPVDAGNPVYCDASPVNDVDERGVTRPKGAKCDIGAFEVLPAAVLAPTSYNVGTAGGRVTLTGTNLESVTSVTLDGVAVTGVVSSGGGTRLNVPIPAHAAGVSVAVVVTNPGTTGVNGTLVYAVPNAMPTTEPARATVANTPAPQPTPRPTLPASALTPLPQPGRH